MLTNFEGAGAGGEGQRKEEDPSSSSYFFYPLPLFPSFLISILQYNADARARTLGPPFYFMVFAVFNL